jgi:hypothetical protein
MPRECDFARRAGWLMGERGEWPPCDGLIVWEGGIASSVRKFKGARFGVLARADIIRLREALGLRRENESS